MDNSQSNLMLKEPIRKILPKFAIPSVISLLISCLYNIVDQIFVGQGLGYLGNAATGIIFPITVIGWGLSLLFGDGGAAFLSINQGAGDTKNAGKSVANSLLLSFLTGAVLIAVSYIAGDSLLYALGATDATIELTRDYGRIIFAMIPIALAGQTLVTIIRADGSPKYAMFTMLVGCVLNIIFDPITIFVWGWGIKGAAYATIFGQFVSFVLAAVYLVRSKTFRVKFSDFMPKWSILKRVIPLGGSSFLTQISIVLVTIVNNKLLVSYGMKSEYGGDIPLAAFVVIMKLFQIVLNIAIGIAAGAQPIIGYNFGAKRYDRVKETFKYVVVSTLIITVLCMLAFEVFPAAFIALFGEGSNVLYANFAVSCLRIYLSLIVLTCLQKTCAIFLQSIGKAKAAIPLSMLRDVVFLIAFSLILPGYIGVTGIFWAAPLADILAMGITAAVVIRVWKQLSGLVSDAEPQTEAIVLKPSKPGVIITIDREHGSSGKYIGQLVAERLGIPYYYKEMIALAAQESGLAKEFISNINEAEPGITHTLYLSTEPVQQAIIAQEKIIRTIADAGSCVIVGRAADFVLRDHKNIVRIFIHAPEAFRIAQVMKNYGDTKEQGEKSIARSDAARSSYFTKISGAEWGAAEQYHLCLDSSIGAEKTADVILAYVNGRGE
ncbi:MAG: MATE family efflux transporter [Christensenellaceae bacterium]|jgi:putative MATE family efflux protein|nr:MATE family efflux transporter [Christensenellaceae bacterium]